MKTFVKKILLLFFIVYSCKITNAQEIILNDGPQLICKTLQSFHAYPIKTFTGKGHLIYGYLGSGISNELAYFNELNELVWKKELTSVSDVYQTPHGILVIYDQYAFGYSTYFSSLIDLTTGETTKPIQITKTEKISPTFRYDEKKNKLYMFKYYTTNKKGDYGIDVDVFDGKGLPLSSYTLNWKDKGKEGEIIDILLDQKSNQLVLHTITLGNMKNYGKEILSQKVMTFNTEDFTLEQEAITDLPKLGLNSFKSVIHNNEIHLISVVSDKLVMKQIGFIHTVYESKTLTLKSNNFIAVNDDVVLKESNQACYVTPYREHLFSLNVNSSNEMILVLKDWNNKAIGIKDIDLGILKLSANDKVKWIKIINFPKTYYSVLYDVIFQNEQCFVFFQDDIENNEIRLKYREKAKSKLRKNVFSLNMAKIDKEGNISYQYVFEADKEKKLFFAHRPWVIRNKCYFIECRKKGVYQFRWYTLPVQEN